MLPSMLSMQLRAKGEVVDEELPLDSPPPSQDVDIDRTAGNVKKVLFDSSNEEEKVVVESELKLSPHNSSDDDGDSEDQQADIDHLFDAETEEESESPQKDQEKEPHQDRGQPCGQEYLNWLRVTGPRCVFSGQTLGWDDYLAVIKLFEI